MDTSETVFVVDDDPAICSSLRFAFRTCALPTETFNSAEDFLAKYDPTRPGCLIVDIRMPGMSGLDLIDELARRKWELPVIVITGYAEVPVAIRALKAGVFDFLEKPYSEQVLIDTVQRSLKRDRELREIRARAAEIGADLARLSARERSLMRLVVAGRTTGEISVQLGLAVRTVDHHRARILEKLRLRSTAELIRVVAAHEVLSGENVEDLLLRSNDEKSEGKT